MSDHRKFVEIVSDGLSAQIDPLGAQLHALRDHDGRDLQWDGDEAVWSGRAPILFPIVGMLVAGKYRLNGETYEMGKHGFARHKLFEVVKCDTSSAVMCLRADAQTRLSYPFEFELELRFSLNGATLTIEATIRNLGDIPMPASFGFHPAFRWPLPFGQPREDHAIVFAQPEPGAVRRMDHQGLLKPIEESTPVTDGKLTLRDELFANDALMFDQIKSQTLRYGADKGPSLRISFPDTPYLGLWTKPGAGFIAIEPWHGINDTEGFAGDIWDKPGIFGVAPGDARCLSMAITLTE